MILRGGNVRSEIVIEIEPIVAEMQEFSEVDDNAMLNIYRWTYAP